MLDWAYRLWCRWFGHDLRILSTMLERNYITVACRRCGCGKGRIWVSGDSAMQFPTGMRVTVCNR